LGALLLRHADAKVSLINVYGCAETTADASCIELKLPNEKFADDWHTVMPLGHALPGCCIGVMMNSADVGQDDTRNVSSHVPAAVPVDASKSISVSWLHDAAAPLCSGRVVVGGVCVAKGYASQSNHRCLESWLEMSSAMFCPPSHSFFAQLHLSNTGKPAEATPVFVTMDVAEIVAQGDGQRQLLYRGRANTGLKKLKGVFVSLERIEDAAQSIAPFCIVAAAAGGEWRCCVTASLVRAAFVDDSVILVVAFDFFCEFSACAAQAIPQRQPLRYFRRFGTVPWLCRV
jgi:hypothetical protein